MSKQHFVNGLAEWDAARAKAENAERRLSHIITALYGPDGVVLGRRLLRPTDDGLVSDVLLHRIVGEPA